MPKQKTFEDMMLEMYNDDYDKVFVKRDNEAEIITPISTGSLSLDTLIGIGGIPKRRFTVIDGPSSSGKTTLAFSIVKNAIANGDKALYIDIENQMHIHYVAELIGQEPIDDGRVIIAKPDTSDNAFEIAEAAISSKEFGLVILDSVGALVPPKEKSEPFDKDSVGVIPKDLAHFLKRNAYSVRLNNVAFVFINQVRDKIGSFFPTYSTPGGHALKHFSSLIISLSKGEEIKNAEKIAIGIYTKFVIKKNKLSAPFRTYLIPLIFGEGIDTVRDTMDFAKFLGVIQTGGPYYKFEGEVLGRGYAETYQVIKKNPQVLDKIRVSCYNAINQDTLITSEEGVDDE